MDRATSAAVLLVACAFTACTGAGVSKPAAAAPDTEIQRKVRSDLELCSDAARAQPHPVTITPEGKYSFEVIGLENANRILACMGSKGYSAKRVDRQNVGHTNTLRSGGEGEPAR
jgi:hypothetical protein